MRMRDQDEMDSYDGGTEITLGVGKLLVLFFALVILCGISLGVGYTLGKNSAKQAATAAPAPDAAATTAAAAPKPGASQVATPKSPDPDPAPAKEATPPPSQTASTEDLTFYQNVQQKEAHPQLTPREAERAPAPAKASEPRNSLGSGYMVQVAAVRNEGDAHLLSETLKKQRYPVVVVQPGDKLYHVQVGPYADVKEAEEMRSRLINAGYTPILKH